MGIFDVSLISMERAGNNRNNGGLNGGHSVQIINTTCIVQRNLLGKEGLENTTINNWTIFKPKKTVP